MKQSSHTYSHTAKQPQIPDPALQQGYPHLSPTKKIHSRNFSKAPLTTPLHRRLFRPNPKAAMFAPFVTPTLSRYPRTDQVQPL